MRAEKDTFHSFFRKDRHFFRGNSIFERGGAPNFRFFIRKACFQTCVLGIFTVKVGNFCVCRTFCIWLTSEFFCENEGFEKFGLHCRYSFKKTSIFHSSKIDAKLFPECYFSFHLGKSGNLTCGKAFFVVGEVGFVWKIHRNKTWHIHFLSNQRFIYLENAARLARIFESNRKFCCDWVLETSTSDLQITHVFSKVYLKFFQVKILTAEEQLSSYKFWWKSLFSASKLTPASSYKCFPRYVENKVGSKCFKEGLLYIISPDFSLSTTFDLRYVWKSVLLTFWASMKI